MVTDRHTDTQNDYCNPAAHAQRVNNGVALSRHDEGHLCQARWKFDETNNMYQLLKVFHSLTITLKVLTDNYSDIDYYLKTSYSLNN